MAERRWRKVGVRKDQMVRGLVVIRGKYLLKSRKYFYQEQKIISVYLLTILTVPSAFLM